MTHLGSAQTPPRPYRDSVGINLRPWQDLPKTRRRHFHNLVFNMILRTHQIPKMFFLLKMFSDVEDPTVTHLIFCICQILKNVLHRKYFSTSLGQVLVKSRASSSQVLGGSWVGLRRVLVKSRASPVGSQSGLERDPIKS